MGIKRRVLPFEIIELDNQNYHILIEASINKFPCNLIIDTGASRTVFDRNYLEDKVEIMDVKNKEMKISGITAGNITTKVARAEEFSLAGFKMKDLQLILIDLAGINGIYENVTGRNIHGLLGSDFLYRHRAVINFEKSTLSLLL